MRCVAGHQPNLYPYCGYFAKAYYVDVFVIVDNTQYVKKEYHNRNKIKLSNGTAQWLSIPVQTSGHFKQVINEVHIDNKKPWRDAHKKRLEYNYKKAPFFHKYYPYFERVLSMNWDLLSDYNITIIKTIFKILNIKTPVYIASKIDISGKSTGLIVDICKKTNSDTYLHGLHARDYVDFKLLENANIKNLIQDYIPQTYFQLYDNFIPSLSILDILFNCGEKSMDILLKGNKITQYR